MDVVEPGEGNPLVRIRSLLPGLAKAEQRVAQVVLSDPESVSRRSITEVAERAGTSETTVTRFCKAIGVHGYPDLRIALASEVARSESREHAYRDLGADIALDDALDKVVGKVAYSDARAVEETAEQVDVATLQRVVDAVSLARRVDVYGVGASAFVASDLQQKLHRIGLTCFAWNDTHIMLTSAAVLRPGDVAIAISHTGSTVDTVEALQEAAKAGATTVAMTNFPRSALARAADHVVTTAARETTFRSGAMSSRIAQLTLIDCLFIGVAQRNLDTADAALSSTRDAVEGHHLDSRPDGRKHTESESR